jgi:hypothetical protein
MCVIERERQRLCVYLCMCVCVCVCVIEKERERLCVYVCVSVCVIEREREIEYLFFGLNSVFPKFVAMTQSWPVSRITDPKSKHRTNN